MTATALWVRKDNLREVRAVTQPVPEPGAGEVLLAVDRFALTANNITYGAVGEMIGYWKFFPTTEEGRGQIPVWGYADVAASNADGVAPGARVYGYFPMGSHLVVKPVGISARGFKDGAEHRAMLPVIYNEYAFVEPGDATAEDLQSLLRPLFATSYLLSDFLEDNSFFGAEQVVICSASSKTAIGLAQLLADDRSHGKPVIGLTSPGNAAFVEGLGAYDQVITYDAITPEVPKKKTVYVDMAGNANTRASLHHHLGDLIQYGCGVGMTHWDQGGGAEDLPGPRPEMFFAPSQIEKRRKDWGPGVVEQKIAETTIALAARSGDWLTVVRDEGADAAMAVYKDMVDGKIAANEGRILSIK